MVMSRNVVMMISRGVVIIMSRGNMYFSFLTTEVTVHMIVLSW